MKHKSQIAQKIAAELKVVITPDEKQLIEKVPNESLKALDFYQLTRTKKKRNLLSMI